MNFEIVYHYFFDSHFIKRIWVTGKSYIYSLLVHLGEYLTESRGLLLPNTVERLKYNYLYNLVETCYKLIIS